MGRDKYENEDLIAYGWPEDVWYVLIVNYSVSHIVVGFTLMMCLQLTSTFD